MVPPTTTPSCWVAERLQPCASASHRSRIASPADERGDLRRSSGNSTEAGSPTSRPDLRGPGPDRRTRASPWPRRARRPETRSADGHPHPRQEAPRRHVGQSTRASSRPTAFVRRRVCPRGGSRAAATRPPVRNQSTADLAHTCRARCSSTTTPASSSDLWPDPGNRARQASPVRRRGSAFTCSPSRHPATSPAARATPRGRPRTAPAPRE